MKADIFFFITSVAVALVTLAVIFFLVYLIRLVRACRKLIRTLEEKADDLSGEAEELIEDIRESFAFRLLFPKPKARRKKKK